MARPWVSAGERGLTLLELVLASAILAILAASALPLYEVTVRREREIELRRSLREIRRALDAFHASYVASGGALSQGGSPTSAVPTPPPVATPRNPNNPNNPQPRNSPQQPGMGGPNGDIPLIDASQFDPIDSKGFPPDLKILVEGVQAFGGGSDDEDLIKFLRRIPIDPMTPKDMLDLNDKNFGWGVRCYQDRNDSRVWCRKNVWDVYSKSHGMSLDGKTRYDEW